MEVAVVHVRDHLQKLLLLKWIAQWLPYLLPNPAARGSILGTRYFPNFVTEEINRQLDKIVQRFDDVDETYLLL